MFIILSCASRGNSNAMLSKKSERLEILFLLSHSTCRVGMEGNTLWEVTSLQSRTREVRPDMPYRDRRSLTAEVKE